MRLAILTALVALGGAGCTAEEEATDVGSARSAVAPEGLSIVTWNLERFPLEPGTPELVASLLAELSPDVVGVQEINDREAFEELAEALPGYAAVVTDDPGTSTRVGMLYREDRVSVSDVETLFPEDGHRFPRAPLKAHVTLSGGSFDFDFLVLHLKAMSDSASEARRRAACEALDAWVSDRIADGADPDVVLAGDLNDRLTDPAHDNVFQVFLDRPAEYRFLTAPVADAGDCSYIPWPSLIDHVLVTTPVLEAYGKGTTEVLHLDESLPGYVKNVSDHRPILTRFAPAAR